MTKKIALSVKTVALLVKLKRIRLQAEKIERTFSLDTLEKTVELPELVGWLSTKEPMLSPIEESDEEDPELLLASVNAALLNDLAKSLPSYKKKKKNESNPSWFNRLKYGLLIFAGTVFFSCEGFDGITSIVGILPLSTTTLFICGALFAFLSVMAFYAFNLTEIAENLEIEKKEARQLVDRYLKEIDEINSIYKQLNDNYIKHKSSEEREDDLLIIELLIARYKALDEGRTVLSKLSENKKLFIIKHSVAVVIGIIYFSSGFFAGQAVATALASLVLSSMASVFWPILALSLIGGFAALSIYWYVERPSINRLVACWFGLDQEKIERLCDAEKIENNTTKLENLKINLCSKNERLALDAEKVSNYKMQLQTANKRIREQETLLLNRKTRGLRWDKQTDCISFFSEAPQCVTSNTNKSLMLRPKSIALIEKLRNFGTCNKILDEYFNSAVPESTQFKQLINWLMQNSQSASMPENEINEKVQFVLTSLNTSLLKDLSNELPDTRKKEKKAKSTSKQQIVIYAVLSLAGTIYFGCEGFDGIVSIISMFSIPKTAVFVIGGIFAALSIMAFYLFDMSDLSKNLGIKKKNINELVDIYLKEIKAINAIRRNLENEYSRHNSLEELQNDLLITELITSRYQQLAEKRDALSKLLAGRNLTMLKYLVAGIVGIIYFSGGFFTGQAVILAIAGLFVASTTSLFWPIFAVSFVIALAALGVYWFVERPNIDKLVSRLYGLDQDKIECLCNPEKIVDDQSKVDILKSNIMIYKDEYENFSQKSDYYVARLQEANSKIKKLGDLLQNNKLTQQGAPREVSLPPSRASSGKATVGVNKSLSMEGFNIVVSRDIEDKILAKPDCFFSGKRPRSKSFNEASFHSFLPY